MTSTIKNNKLILEFEPDEINAKDISFLQAMMIKRKSKASKEDIKSLADEITQGWWQKNKAKFIDEDSN